MSLIPTLTAFLSGLIFSLGLILSGMIDPARVLAFLDVTGAWNPALALVMASAVATAVPAYAWMRRKHRTVLGTQSHVPRRRAVDLQLVLGAAIFGLGWGLAGLCPGPGLILAGSGNTGALVFVTAMGAAMYFAANVDALLSRRRKGNADA